MAIQDQRSRKLVVAAHCILNQNSRVSGLAQYSATIPEIVNILQENNIGILQLPCPELIHCGTERSRKTKEEYDTVDYRRVCRQIADTITDQLNEYTRSKVDIIALVGIKSSPTCGAGNSPIETGILIEELKSTLEKKGKTIIYHNLDTKKVSDSVKWLKKIIQQNTNFSPC